MAKKTRNTPIGAETAIVDGWLYFEDVRQAEIDTELFAEMLGDKYTTSIRLISLPTNWTQRVWVGSVIVSESLNLQMTLRKEIRSGVGYWYAYRRVFGKLHKKFVGQSDRVTVDQLVKVAQKMPSL